MPVLTHFKVTPFLCFEKLGVRRLQTTAPDSAEQPHLRAKKRFLDLRHLDSEEWTMDVDPHFLWKWCTHVVSSMFCMVPQIWVFCLIGVTRPWRNIILSNSFHFYLQSLISLFYLVYLMPKIQLILGRNKPEPHTVLWNDFWLLNVSIDSVIKLVSWSCPQKNRCRVDELPTGGMVIPFIGNPEKTWVFLNALSTLGWWVTIPYMEMMGD